MIRALVHRGAKSEPRAGRGKTPPGEAMCERCGNVFRDKRWLPGTSGERRWPVGFTWTVCPACREIAAQEFYGRVLIGGKGALEEEDAIRERITNVAKRARFTQPQRRIVSMERKNGQLEVLTTSQKLAHRIVAALLRAFGGDARFTWSSEDGELEAAWTWQGKKTPGAPVERPGRLSGRARAARVRDAASAVGKSVPDLSIQSRNVDIDPVWRERIERRVERWGERLPGLTRVHVTLARGRHHRRGVEEVSIGAQLARRNLFASKRAETMPVALREALNALERELNAEREGERHLVKPPGARLEGTVKRIWRDSGYGFIRLDRGREAYFHRDSLQGLKFATLTPGMPVEVEVEAGEKGLQASRVFPVGQKDRA